MEHDRQGGWVYIMADRDRGTMYVGVTAHLAARIHQHRTGDGSDFCRRYGLQRLVCAEHAPLDHRLHRAREAHETLASRMEVRVGRTRQSGLGAICTINSSEAEEAGPRVKPGVTGRGKWRSTTHGSPFRHRAERGRLGFHDLVQAPTSAPAFAGAREPYEPSSGLALSWM